jgi:predicted CXXCH cytochrome family protein
MMTALLALVLWVAQAPAQKPAHPPLPGKAGDEACVTCHKPIVARKVLHGPVAAGSCLSCHEVKESGGTVRITLAGGVTADNETALCLTCHDDMAARLKQKAVHAPVAGGACSSCHDPHGSDFRFMLPAEGTASCLTCHSDIQEAMGAAFTHEPAKQACTVCHDPHAGPFAGQTRVELNLLCLSCHSDTPIAAPDPGELPPPETAAWPKLAAGMAKAGRRLPPLRNAKYGHPTVKHPVAGPTDLIEATRPLTCASCHNPHGGASRQLFRYGASSGMELCLKCHKF